VYSYICMCVVCVLCMNGAMRETDIHTQRMHTPFTRRNFTTLLRFNGACLNELLHTIEHISGTET